MEHNCAACPRFPDPQEAAACLARKVQRLRALPSFDQAAWDLVKYDLRPDLANAVMLQDWETVAEIWQNKRWILEKAIAGKHTQEGTHA